MKALALISTSGVTDEGKLLAARRALLIHGLLFVWIAPLLVNGRDDDHLFDRSPFIPSGFQVEEERPFRSSSVVKTEDGEIIFQGVYQINGVYRFNLFNRKTKRSRWLSLSDLSEYGEIIGFNPAANTLRLNQGGRIEVLELVDSALLAGVVPMGGRGEILVNINDGRRINSSTDYSPIVGGSGVVSSISQASRIDLENRVEKRSLPRGIRRYQKETPVGSQDTETIAMPQVEKEVQRDTAILKNNHYRNPRFRHIP